MKRLETLESVSLADSDLNQIMGDDRTLRFEHWHPVGGFTDENGIQYTVQQRCTWWGFYETTQTRTVTD
ncbi:MAG: hypothetical protein WHS63_01275 [Tenuifilum sp.]